MITTIIFDYYGVFQPDIYVEWLNRNGLKRTGIFDSLAKQLDHGEITRTEFVASLSEVLERNVSYDEIYATAATIDQRMVNLARNLGGHYTVGLLSNASKDLHQKLKDNEIDDLFDTIIVSSDVGVAKPAEEIYSITLTSLKASPRETAYIDDNPNFIRAGNRVGMDSILFESYDQLCDDLIARDIQF